MDPDRLPEELALAVHDIEGLLHAGLVRHLRPKLPPKPHIDYAALHQTYRRLLAETGCAGQAEGDPIPMVC